MNINFVVTTSASGLNRDQLKRDSIFCAWITERLSDDEDSKEERKDAITMKLPMFALIKKTAKITDEIQKMPWIKVIIYNNDSDFKMALAVLHKCIDNFLGE